MSTVRISAIAAAAENDVIGKDNDLLWHIPADFAHFKKTTMGKPMIMGRKTFESLPGVLRGRVHIVVSRSGYTHPDVTSCASLEEAIEAAKQYDTDEIFIIGGAQIYEQALPLCDRIYLTRVHGTYEGDAYFPALDMKDWEIKSQERFEGAPAFTIYILDRK